MKRQGKQKIIAVVAIVFFGLGIEVFGHNDEDHGKKPKTVEVVSDTEEQTLARINEEYIAQVKPMFQTSCMNCHGSNTEYPWYHSLPGAKQLINYDVRESKVHLDMSNDFPFGGHGSPAEDLEAIKKSIDEKTMPPLRYRALHWSSSLKSEEIRTVHKWIESSLKALKQAKETK